MTNEGVSVLFSVIMAANTIMQVTPNMVTFSRAATAASELFALIDRQSEIDPFDESGDKPGEITGTINLNGINFSYPTRPDVSVLEDFTLNIPAGKVTALVVSTTPPCLVEARIKPWERDLLVVGKAPSLACLNGGIILARDTSLWMAGTSASSTSSGCEPMSV